MPDPLLGEVLLDSYRVVRLLGAGAMGAVYEGQHLRLPRKGLAPVADQVVALRGSGASWSRISTELGCTVASARRACQRGAQNQLRISVEDGTASWPRPKGKGLAGWRPSAGPGGPTCAERGRPR